MAHERSCPLLFEAVAIALDRLIFFVESLFIEIRDFVLDLILVGKITFQLP